MKASEAGLRKQGKNKRLRIPTVTNSDSRERRPSCCRGIEACLAPSYTSTYPYTAPFACPPPALVALSSCDALLALSVYLSPDAHTCLQPPRPLRLNPRPSDHKTTARTLDHINTTAFSDKHGSRQD
jgi:hypothetical protein